MKSTLQSENPERRSGWTGLYHDTSVKYWTLTFQKPVGASNISLEAIGTPEPGSASTYNDLAASRLFEALRDNNLLINKNVVTNLVDGRVLIVNHIASARWWYVTSYPTSQIRKQALMLPIQFSLGALLLVLITLGIVYWLINRDVSTPLRYMANVASMIDAKNYKDVVSESAKKIKSRGEVGLVLQAIRTVAGRFIRAQEQLELEVANRTAELAEANKLLDRLAHLDGLTALMNRRSFDRDLAAAIAEGKTTWLVLGDIDDFKLYNDNYGHEAGDVALQKISKLLSKKFQGRVYRYGGEELAIILPITNKDIQITTIQSILADIYLLNITHIYSRHNRSQLSMSFGVAPVFASDTPEEAIRRADEQLYKAKHAGGNIVQFYRET